MTIVDKEKFIGELEWFESFDKKRGGPYQEKLILFCDKWRLANQCIGPEEIEYTVRFIGDIFERAGIYLTPSENYELKDYFNIYNPSYYTIEPKIVELFKKARNLLLSESKHKLEEDKKSIIPKPKVKEAVFLFIVCDTGSILMVSRKNGKYGLPGGKVEDGETHLEALVREVKEEIGMLVEEESLQLLYSSWCDGYLCHTYGIFKDNKFVALNKNKLIESGMLESSEGLEIVFKVPEEMQELSEYSHYNIGVLGSWVEHYEKQKG